MNSNVYPRCQYCGNVPKEGLYDGIRVNGVLFCKGCTEEVTHKEPGDSLYERFRKKLKEALNHK